MEAVVADDSGFIRSVVSDILSKDGIEVIAQARNGEEAVEKVIEHRPDVVTMDVEMPERNGIEAVDDIMDEEPTPVVMFSSHTVEGSERTLEALEKGAVDFVSKPRGDGPGITAVEDEITRKVREGARASPQTVKDIQPSVEDEGVDASEAVVVVGASTGGPGVVESVLKGLPSTTGIRVAVVQHMPEVFTRRLAERLDERTDLNVYEASDGDVLEPGECAVAPGDGHLLFKNHYKGSTPMAVDNKTEVNNVMPAIDVTLRSAARYVEEDAYAVVLTGMGSDGARGADRLKRKGGTVIAQNEETCAVYGIPGSVVEDGNADEILPPEKIPNEILRQIGGEA
ncbi:chemotaxis-specific protein-glutamate methyltransferase CheB [Haladaptatus sp. F3-133]|uniref:Protein-glutamate methylesterase/protein-glutamine glutaminase n=1 Tax=Halorutilus salinus TaxID=2487751 RepID=A0A9Q4C2S8_9EURY|nr:chemotaxis-specific protein-glutamate methyltransferase CheB [Halorutilus salinus]MCX2818418.1 chemotaxis-specific protein-glutamate methyltransferase CheB [Halorutilus salinus]